VLFDETEELDDGEDCRALGMAQNECKLDWWSLDWALGGREETGSCGGKDEECNCCCD
jgi:hypothetical protein